MKILSNIETAKCRELIELECEYCHSSFKKPKNMVLSALNGNGKRNYHCCSIKCLNIYIGDTVSCKCKQCEKSIYIKKSKYILSKNHFCSSSCAAIYNNANKAHGYRRSKLEIWLEAELIKLYPNLEIHFNRKDAINSELDIYIPSLKLAFELNGIFHYEPIYGNEQLSKIQNNDNRKFQACLEKGIEFCIIDISKQKNFRESSSFTYLSIIQKIINLKSS